MKKTFFKRVMAIALAATLSFAALPIYSVEASERIGANELMEMSSSPITRGQFAMLLNTVFGFGAVEGENFADVPADHPYALDLATENK